MADDLKALFLLDPDVTFLNHGSYGACPRPVFADYQDWQLRLECQPVAFLDPRHLARRFAEVRVRLGACLGAAPDDLVPVVNATAGLNAVARSLPLSPGDEIVTTDHEYGALDKTWAYVAARRGALIRRVAVPVPLTSAADFTARLMAAVTDRTRVLFLSHVTSATALVFPLADLIARARARGIWTVIDGAHAPGQIALNLNALGADFYAGNCHKWLMAPKGAAFLHARPEVQPLLTPALISHGWTAAAAATGPFGGTAFQDAFQFQGTRDPAAFLTVPAALSFRAAQGWDQVAARCALLAEETAARILRLTGGALFGAAAFRAPQMIAVPLPSCDPAALHDRLLADHGIEVPVCRWHDQVCLRFSVQGYNSAADMDRLLAAVGVVFGLKDRG